MVVGKKTKSILVIVVWSLAVLVFVFTLLQIFYPGEHTAERAVYSADAEAKIDYTVKLTSTPVFSKAQDAEPSRYYVMPFTDYIELNCSYSLNSDYESKIAANSYLTAFLVSYIEEGGNEVVLWKKEYTLAELESNEIIGNNITGEKSVNLRFEEYSALIDQIYDMYEYSTGYYLMVVYTTEFDLEHGEDAVTKIMQPYLRINIEDLFYSIEEDNKLNDKIEVNKQVTVTGEINWDYVVIGAIVFIILAVLAMLIPTKLLVNTDMTDAEKAIKQIDLQYGDRIIKIMGKPILQENAVQVVNIEDVIKIADETGLPVFSVAADDEIYYYVVIDNIMYYVNMHTK